MKKRDYMNYTNGCFVSLTVLTFLFVGKSNRTKLFFGEEKTTKYEMLTSKVPNAPHDIQSPSAASDASSFVRQP